MAEVTNEEAMDHWRAVGEQHWQEWLDLTPGRRAVWTKLVEGVPKSAKILDVGCGNGRHLALLADLGYTRLEGVEISAHAVHVLRHHYAQLKDVPIHIGAAEAVLPTLSGRYDLVVCNGVFVTIPDATVLFDEVARIAWSLLVVDVIGIGNPLYTDHDYVRAFETRGMRLRSKVALSEFEELDDDPHLTEYAYFAYRFDVNERESQWATATSST